MFQTSIWVSGVEDSGERPILTLLGGSLPAQPHREILAWNRTDPISEPKDTEGGACLPLSRPPGHKLRRILQASSSPEPRTTGCDPGVASTLALDQFGRKGRRGDSLAGSQAAPHSPHASASASRLTTSAQLRRPSRVKLRAPTAHAHQPATGFRQGHIPPGAHSAISNRVVPGLYLARLSQRPTARRPDRPTASEPFTCAGELLA